MSNTTEVRCDFNDELVTLEDYPTYQYLGFLVNGACVGCKIKHVKSAKKHAVTHVDNDVIMCAEIDERNPQKHLDNLIRDNKSFDDVRGMDLGSVVSSLLANLNSHKPPENLP